MESIGDQAVDRTSITALEPRLTTPPEHCGEVGKTLPSAYTLGRFPPLFGRGRPLCPNCRAEPGRAAVCGDERQLQEVLLVAYRTNPGVDVGLRTVGRLGRGTAGVAISTRQDGRAYRRHKEWAQVDPRAPHTFVQRSTSPCFRISGRSEIASRRVETHHISSTAS